MFLVFQSEIYFDWMVRLLAISLIVQSIELLRLKVVWSDDCIYSWSILRGSIRFARPITDILFKQNIFHILFVANVASALSLLIFGLSWVIFYPLFFICLLFIRLGGTFNGGSDAMTALVLATCSARVAFSDSEKVVKFCLWYLTFQIVLSYLVAGIVKIRNSSWRRGDALKILLSRSNYVVPEKVLRLVNRSGISFVAGWAILIFECSFPLALFSKDLALIYIGLAVVFHLANFFILGLNRFVWAWIAAYPALWCVVSLKL